MPFVKGDPNINRKGRPLNSESEEIRKALDKEGIKRGEDFWEAVAKKAFTDIRIMIALIKKLLPDTLEHSGEVKGGNTQIVLVNPKNIASQTGIERLHI